LKIIVKWCRKETDHDDCDYKAGVKYFLIGLLAAIRSTENEEGKSASLLTLLMKEDLITAKASAQSKYNSKKENCSWKSPLVWR
jgi:hypothetical protein